MNNNRNNRRRSRGNRQQGGPNQGNRIDSRARGNAPQLLEKYKKLAQDAQHNGDRVQMEYYLQFADHYFRVIADNKARQDEHRARRGDDRSDDRDDADDEEQDDRRNARRNTRGRRRDNDDRDDRDDETGGFADQGERGQEGDAEDDGDNPFARESRRPRKPRRARDTATDDDGDEGDAGTAIDAAALPPSIASSDGDKPKRRAAPRRRKADPDEGALEAVG